MAGMLGHPSDGNGQQGGDPAENEEGKDSQQREGDGLGEAEVRLSLLACLHAGHIRFPEQHVTPSMQRRLDVRDDRVRVGRGAERGDHE
jgi:hypothetical protein